MKSNLIEHDICDAAYRMEPQGEFGVIHKTKVSRNSENNDIMLEI